MSTKTSHSLVILFAVILSACTTKTPGVENQADDKKTPGTEQSLSTSVRELLGLGQNQKCTYSASFTDESATTTTTGTIYIAGKRMAQEVQVVSTGDNAISTDMRMISDGTTIYTWDPSKKTPGMMFKVVEPTGTTDTKTENQNVDLDKKMDMKCSAWTVDEAKFTVPTDIQFTDLSELMKNIPTVPAIPGK
jgi:hypothetical protein